MHRRPFFVLSLLPALVVGAEIILSFFVEYPKGLTIRGL